ncbi:TPA: hypothetical protein N0F65_007599 [Lagenidium giganteum]|uniref:Ribosomal protein L32 n=1 Tax=Lagenidium giganteum TaxID=4803 RepID=A0AAV2ZG28_9STRA|nr:TPA: hypothetical protein N0F65_007599 [Lagenidium giganteum]
MPSTSIHCMPQNRTAKTSRRPRWTKSA